MKNYEKYHVDEMSIKDIENIAVTKDGVFTRCGDINCTQCIFFDLDFFHPGFCHSSLIKWLLEEYKEPETDWSKVPVDTKVLVKIDKEWERRYFAGVTEFGEPMTFEWGRTSWSGRSKTVWDEDCIKLYDEMPSKDEN